MSIASTCSTPFASLLSTAVKSGFLACFSIFTGAVNVLRVFISVKTALEPSTFTLYSPAASFTLPDFDRLRKGNRILLRTCRQREAQKGGNQQHFLVHNFLGMKRSAIRHQIPEDSYGY